MLNSATCVAVDNKHIPASNHSQAKLMPESFGGTRKGEVVELDPMIGVATGAVDVVPVLEADEAPEVLFTDHAADCPQSCGPAAGLHMARSTMKGKEVGLALGFPRAPKAVAPVLRQSCSVK